MQSDADLTLSALLRRQAQTYGQRVLVRSQEQEFTYGEFDALTNRIANALAEMGIARGDKVALLLPNGPAFLLAWWGAVKLGAVQVPVGTAFADYMVEYVLTHSDATACIIGAEFLPIYTRIGHRLPGVQRLIVSTGATSPVNLPAGAVTLATLLKSSEAPPASQSAPGDACAIMYTSGSTGPNKGVLWPQRSVIHAGQITAAHRRVTPADVLYSPLPLFHTNALLYSFMTALCAGAACAVGETFNPAGFWDDIRTFGATQFNFSGSVLTRLYKQPARDDDRDHPCRLAWGTAVPPHLAADFATRFGVRLLEVYGTTESGVVLQSPYDNPRPGSCGLPAPGLQVRIVDAHDRPLDPGAIGEIVCRPDAPHTMMLEYYKMPEKTVQAFQNLWLHTGDYGYQDADGYFYFVDRKEDAIVRGGRIISSYAIEQVLHTHPAVAESAAVLDDDSGIRALIVLQPGQTLDPAALLAHAAAQLPADALPQSIAAVDSLPKTPTQRVEKYRLRNRPGRVH